MVLQCGLFSASLKSRLGIQQPKVKKGRICSGASQSTESYIHFTSSPLGALVALGRLEGGAWRTRHRTIDLPAPASPSRRALAMLCSAAPSPRRRRRLAQGVRELHAPGSIAATRRFPAGDTPAKYRAALADLFGRFGPAAEFDVATPKRPAPPVPATNPGRAHGPEGVGGPPASPGHVKVAIVVLLGCPELLWLAPSHRSTCGWMAGTPESTTLAPIPAGTTQTVTSEFVLPVLAVGATGTTD